MGRIVTGLVLGVDGGASKTVAIVADRTGRVLGTGRSGNADIYQTPDAETHVAAAIAQALTAAGAKASDLNSATLSLVGADWPEDFDHWRTVIKHTGIDTAQTMVVNDAIGALWAGAPAGPAVAVVLGTGCAVGARGPDGRIWHSSFWQRTQGGAELATRALDAVYLAALGLGPTTTLTNAALHRFGALDVKDLLHRLTGRHQPRTVLIATFARAVLDAAAAGDPVAVTLVTEQGTAIAGYARAAAARVGITAQARLVLAGGICRHPARLMPHCVELGLARVVPHLVLVDNPPEPVAGAVLIALSQAGTVINDDVQARVQATLPTDAYFATAVEV